MVASLQVKKLIEGIVEFRQKLRPEYQETFARLALGQSPDTLFIACSDSRVVPNLFASTNPGDLFVVRNVGNLIAPSDLAGLSIADESEAAAIEFAISNLGVKDIIVCGHSECGAIRALMDGREKITSPNLRSWLRHSEQTLNQKNTDQILIQTQKEKHNHISQLNVLQQIFHLKTYPTVMEKIKSGHLRVHGWWFELSCASVHAYEESEKKFILIDEAEAKRILEKLEK